MNRLRIVEPGEDSHHGRWLGQEHGVGVCTCSGEKSDNKSGKNAPISPLSKQILSYSDQNYNRMNIDKSDHNNKHN